MKKIKILFLCALLLMISTFPGCASQERNAQIELCVDIPGMRLSDSSSIQMAVNNLIAEINTLGIEPEITVRFIAQEGDERETELRKLKTEIMAGKGPDLFLIGYTGEMETMLFPSPEKSMQNKLFLPLDSYLENTKYMEKDNFLSTVWDAGSWDGTQYILPLTYTFPATIFHAEDVSLDAPMTYGEMVENPDLNFVASASWVRPGATLGNHFIDTFEKILDTENDSVSLSGSELQEHMRQILEVTGKERDGKLSEADPHFQVNMSVGFNAFPDVSQGITPEDNIAIVPFFNSAGGISASVKSYMVISAATEYPEGAFEIADYLLSKSTQSGTLYRMLTERTSLPIDTSLLVPGNDSSLWEMTETSYQEFLKVQDMISYVRLPSYSDYLLSTLYWDCYSCYFGYQEGNIDEILSDGYRSLQMFAGES